MDAQSNQQMRILIVDDHVDTCELFTIAFKKRGHEVMAATCKSDALDALSTVPELLVLDYNIPGLDISHFLQAVRDARQDPVVILVSCIPDLAEVANSLGIRHYLKKPCDFDALLKLAESARQ